MPDDTLPEAKASEKESPSQPRPKRVSTKRPKKREAEKPAQETNPVEDHTPPRDNSENGSSDGKGENEKNSKKRTNRRRRGKGKSSNEHGDTAPEESKDDSGKKSRDEPEGKSQRRRLNPEKVATKAWKIFLAEVSEEGVALIGDNDARELSRRCFRLAELFMEEQERRG